MKNIDFDVVTPLYEQIYADIIDAIDKGVYKCGEQIPTENELQAKYNVSRVTVRNALTKLCDGGIVIKHSGKGTFVSMPAFFETKQAEGSFTKSCLMQNAVPSTEIIDIQKIATEKSIAEKLNIEKGEPVIRIKRLRLVNLTACIFEVDYFKMEFDFMMTADVSKIPLLEIIRDKTGKIGRKTEAVIEIAEATSEHAKWLQCSTRKALLGVKQLVTTGDDEILYYNEQFICSDRYKYVVGNKWLETNLSKM